MKVVVEDMHSCRRNGNTNINIINIIDNNIIIVIDNIIIM